MVEAIIKLLRRETSGLHQAAFLLGLFAFLSQVLALVRDKLLASLFGADSVLDLYYAAFRIPDFLFVTLGSLVSLSVLIPFFLKEMEKEKEEARNFIDSVFSVFFFLMIAVSVVTFFLIPWLVSVLFPGFDILSQEKVAKLSQILLLSPIFLGVSNLFGSIVQANNRFLVYALAPLAYNIGIIIGITFFFKIFGIVGLVYGVVLGALFHLIIQIPTVLHLGFIPRFSFAPRWRLIKEVALLSVPRTIALSVSHIAILFLISFASFMEKGSIAVFNLAWNLQSVPLSIFGVSYSLAAFPALSRFYAQGDKDNFLIQFTTSLRHIIFWLVPCTTLFIVLRAHIVRLVLGSGAFDWTDTRLTAAMLALFALSVTFQAITLLCIRALYATGSTGKPFSVTIFSGIAIVIGAYLFSYIFENFLPFRYFLEDLLKISDLPGSQVVTLALGFTIGTIIESVLLWFFVVRTWEGLTVRVIRPVFHAIGAGVLLSFSTYLSLKFFNNFFSLETFWGVFVQALLSFVVGVCVWVLALFLMKNEELSVVSRTLHQKFWQTKPTSPDADLS